MLTLYTCSYIIFIKICILTSTQWSSLSIISSRNYYTLSTIICRIYTCFTSISTFLAYRVSIIKPSIFTITYRSCISVTISSTYYTICCTCTGDTFKRTSLTLGSWSIIIITISTFTTIINISMCWVSTG